MSSQQVTSEPRANAHVEVANPAEATVGPPPSMVTVLSRRVIPFVMLAGVYAALTRWAAQPLGNFDTYFHLRFGHEFLTGNWSLRDPGSVTTYATGHWVPTQWLPELVMAKTEDWFGLSGVAWLSGVQFLALAVTLFLAARRVADPIVAAPLLVVAMIGASSGLSMRPQVISYIFVILTLVAWDWSRKNLRAPWLLIPLTWVWAMCHGMWPLGIVISIAAVAGMTLDGQLRGGTWLRHASVPVLAGLAAGLLTPVGPKLLPAVLLVNSRGQYFSEWAPPDFTSPQCLAVLLLLGLALLLMTRRGSVDWFTIAMLGLSGGFAVYSLRTVPVAACLVTPLVAAELQRLLGPRLRVHRRELVVVLGGAAVALAALTFAVPTTSSSPPPQPAWVDPTLNAMPDGTKILDDSGFGGYLMWRYPDLDFMFSGYGDLYTDDELENMSDIGALEPGWDDLVRDAGPAYALLTPTSPLAYALREQEGWTVVHHDTGVEMLQPPPGWMDE